MPVQRGRREAEILLHIRFRHALAGIAAVRHGFGVISHFEGDATDGLWHSNHDSESMVAVWGADGLVLLGLDLGTYDFNETLTLAELVDGVPPALMSLVERGAKREDWRVPSAVVWFGGGGEERERMRSRNRSLVVEELFRDPLEAFEEDGSGDRSLYGLGEADGALALELAERSARGPTTITASEEAALFEAQPEDDPVPQMDNVRQAIEIFGQLGIAWPSALETASRVGEEAERRRLEGDVDRGLALLRAVDGGDLGEVRALVAAGANVEKQCPPGWLSPGRLGQTPLVVAVERRDRPLVELLLDSGADLNRGHAALSTAARRADVEMCRLLLQRGAQFGVPWYGENGGLVDCRFHQGVEVIRLFLDAGASLPEQRFCRELADIARAGGAEDLVARLLPEG